MSVKMLAKIKELGLENTALVKKSGKVDLSAILQLPKGHPLLDYYMAERKRVTDANKQMKNTELASEDAFQKQLADIEKKNDDERKKAYDDLIQTRINLQNSLKTKSLNYNDIFKMSGAGTSGSTAASSAARKLAEETDKARKAYENLNAEIQRMKFNALDAIEQENTTYANRMTVLKTALEQSAITQEQYRTTEQELTQLHLDKLSELYNEHYEREAEKRKEQIDRLRETERDWSESTPLDAFTDKLQKYGLTWDNVLTGNFQKSKLTATQITGVYAQASSAIGGYIGNIAQGFEKNSGMYKALFALQKSFAVASSILSIYQGAANAMAAPYPQNLVAWAGVLAQGLALVGQIKSINYSGAYDKGGYIPSGAVGLVGEIGPELIKGPATVTGRKDTADMLRQNSITVNLIEDRERAGTVQQSERDDQQMIDIFVANIRSGGDTALPQPLQESYSADYKPSLIRTTFTDGSARQRTMPYNASDFSVSCTLMLTGAQWVDFWNFYKNLNYGADWFTMNLPLDNSDTVNTRTVRIKNGEIHKDLQFRNSSNFVYKVSFVLDVRE